MTRRFIPHALIIILLGSTGHALASQYRLTANGVITTMPQGQMQSPFVSVAIGQPWSIECVFADNSPDSEPQPWYGVYDDGVISWRLTVGSVNISLNPRNYSPNLQVQDRTQLGQTPDTFTFFPALDDGGAMGGLTLEDFTGTAFTSDALPLSTPGPFDSQHFDLFDTSFSHTAHGTVSTYAITPVPEPASALLLVSGMFLLKRRRAA